MTDREKFHLTFGFVAGFAFGALALAVAISIHSSLSVAAVRQTSAPTAHHHTDTQHAPRTENTFFLQPCRLPCVASAKQPTGSRRYTGDGLLLTAESNTDADITSHAAGRLTCISPLTSHTKRPGADANVRTFKSAARLDQMQEAGAIKFPALEIS